MATTNIEDLYQAYYDHKNDREFYKAWIVLQELEELGRDVGSYYRDLVKEEQWVSGDYMDWSSGTDYSTKQNYHDAQLLSQE